MAKRFNGLVDRIFVHEVSLLAFARHYRIAGGRGRSVVDYDFGSWPFALLAATLLAFEAEQTLTRAGHGSRSYQYTSWIPFSFEWKLTEYGIVAWSHSSDGNGLIFPETL
jgi:hypothetical protein